MFLVATMLFSSLYAADCKKSVITEPIADGTESIIVPDDYYCGTGTYTVTGTCWSATAEVTVCGDFEGQAEANIVAGLAARQERILLTAMTLLFDALLPCN